MELLDRVKRKRLRPHYEVFQHPARQAQEPTV